MLGTVAARTPCQIYSPDGSRVSGRSDLDRGRWESGLCLSEFGDARNWSGSGVPPRYKSSDSVLVPRSVYSGGQDLVGDDRLDFRQKPTVGSAVEGDRMWPKVVQFCNGGHILWGSRSGRGVDAKCRKFR